MKHSYKEIQQALKDFGLYKGAIDGKFGRKSKRALRQFQRLHNLHVDGIIGKNTLRELFHPIIEDRENLDFPSIITDTRFPIETRSQEEIYDFYGNVGENQTKIILPYKMKLAWNQSIKISKMTCHKKVAENLQYIFEESLKTYGEKTIKSLGLDLFGGSLNVRKMRGANRYSLHSWGIAVDLDPVHNRLRMGNDLARFARFEYEPFWGIVEQAGATSLGRTKGYDWMHFQFANR